MYTTATAICAIVIAALLMLLSVPLIMKAIPMNRDYGFRWPEAFRSNEDWHEINVFGGWCTLIANLPLLILALLTLLRPGLFPDFPILGGLVFCLSMMTVLILTYAHAKRTGRRAG